MKYLLARIPARPRVKVSEGPESIENNSYINITAPGKKGASTNPRKKRVTISPEND
jgi:hypothetical protein